MIWCDLGSSEVIWGHLVGSGVIWTDLGSSGGIWGHLGMYEAPTEVSKGSCQADCYLFV